MVPDGDFKNLSLVWFNITTATTGMKKLQSGYLLKEILDRFTNKSESELWPNVSLWMYFTHDITLASMLNSLGVFNVFCIYSTNENLFLIVDTDII